MPRAGHEIYMRCSVRREEGERRRGEGKRRGEEEKEKEE